EGQDSLYLSLFDEPRAVQAQIELVSGDFGRVLASAFSLDHVKDANPAEIWNLLSTAVHAIVALDVGQGNATALSGDVGDIALYFDFGGGVISNTKTFPKNHAHFCLRPAMPIVLSHWDWDHWSSAERAGSSSYDCKWIVPRQPLGANHRKHAA